MNNERAGHRSVQSLRPAMRHANSMSSPPASRKSSSNPPSCPKNRPSAPQDCSSRRRLPADFPLSPETACRARRGRPFFPRSHPHPLLRGDCGQPPGRRLAVIIHKHQPFSSRQGSAVIAVRCRPVLRALRPLHVWESFPDKILRQGIPAVIRDNHLEVLPAPARLPPERTSRRNAQGTPGAETWV